MRCSSPIRRIPGRSSLAWKPFDQRKHSAAEINAEINAKIAQIQQGFASLFAAADFRAGSGLRLFALYSGPGRSWLRRCKASVNAMSGTIMQTPGMHFPISTYQANVPQLDVQVDRDKAKAQGVSLTDLFGTLQTYLGSSYVNDFNQFGRTMARHGAGRRSVPQAWRILPICAPAIIRAKWCRSAVW